LKVCENEKSLNLTESDWLLLKVSPFGMADPPEVEKANRENSLKNNNQFRVAPKHALALRSIFFSIYLPSHQKF
jgi:hypothetical protein